MCGCYRTTSCWGGGTRVYLFIFFFFIETYSRLCVDNCWGFFIGSTWKVRNRYILVLQEKIRRRSSLSLSRGPCCLFGYGENLGTLFLSQF